MHKLTGPIARAEMARRAYNKTRGTNAYEPAGPEVLAYVAENGPISGAQLTTWAGKSPAKAAAKVARTNARKADPAKAKAAKVADKAGARGSSAWWTAYKGERARQRAAAAK